MLQTLSFRTFILLPLLLIPAVAMQFTKEVNWSFGDFLMMGFLLTLVGAALDLLRQKVTSLKKRNLWGLLILLTFILLWAEMAVGIFGSPLAGN